jgi:hypothetical protein
MYLIILPNLTRAWSQKMKRHSGLQNAEAFPYHLQAWRCRLIIAIYILLFTAEFSNKNYENYTIRKVKIFHEKSLRLKTQEFPDTKQFGGWTKI